MIRYVLAAFVVGQVLDALMCVATVAIAGPSVEANPLVHAVLLAGGPGALVVIKVATALITAKLVWMQRQSRWAMPSALFLALVSWLGAASGLFAFATIIVA